MNFSNTFDQCFQSINDNLYLFCHLQEVLLFFFSVIN